MPAATLSNELLIEIFRPLNIKTLASISLCSRRFSELAKPLLYSIYVEPIFDDQSNGFIRTIFESPCLAPHVKHYVGDGGMGTLEGSRIGSFAHTYGTSIQQDLLPKYFEQQVVDQLCFDALVLGNWDATSAILLLLFCGNLESITMESYGDSYDDDGADYIHINRVLQKMKELQESCESITPCMSRVRRVNIEQDNAFIEVQLSLIVDYLGLKSVREVSVSQLGNEYGAETELFESLPMYHHITDLTLVRCNLDDDAFRKFISRFASLKRLHWQHDGGCDCREPPAIDDHLAHLKRSLEELTIDTPFYDQKAYGGLIDEDAEYDGEDPYDELPSMIGSFAQFEKVKKLDISCDILIREGTSWEKAHHVEAFLRSLPPNLEHLKILNCRKNGLESGVSLLSNGPPHLKTLNLTLNPDFRMKRGWGPVTVESLQKMALEKGVEFTWEILL